MSKAIRVTASDGSEHVFVGYYEVSIEEGKWAQVRFVGAVPSPVVAFFYEPRYITEKETQEQEQ